jgi:hypothetical protein
MTTTQKLTKKKLQGESKMTKEKKIKVSELPEEEQKALISEAMSLGIQGILTGWGVETLKNKIEGIKAKKGDKPQAEQTPPQTEEQNGNGEQQTDGQSDGEQTPPQTEEQNGNGEQQTDEQGDGEQTEPEQQTDEELPDDLDDEAKDFLNGKTDELPQNAEEITVQEAEELQNKAQKDEPIPGEKIVVKEKTKRPINGICHICGSKVVDGVCQGCGFKR